MAADRRIDPAGCVGPLRRQRLVERFAHAVQALELVAGDAACLSITVATVSALWVANCG